MNATNTTGSAANPIRVTYTAMLGDGTAPKSITVEVWRHGALWYAEALVGEQSQTGQVWLGELGQALRYILPTACRARLLRKVGRKIEANR